MGGAISDLSERPPGSKTKIFVSYGHEDTSFCDDLFGDLTQYPLEVSRDRESLRIGQPLKAEIKALIDKADFVVCLLSAESLASVWVLWELWNALGQTFTPVGSKLVVVLLDNTVLSNQGVFSIGERFKAERKCLSLQFQRHIEIGMGVSHLQIELDGLKEAIDKLDVLVSHIRSLTNVDLCRQTDYATGIKRLAQHVLGEAYVPPTPQAVTKKKFEDWREELMSKYFDRRGSLAEREAWLLECARQTADLVDQYAPKAKQLRNKAIKLRSRYLNQSADAREEDRKSALSGMSDEIIDILYDEIFDRFKEYGEAA